MSGIDGDDKGPIKQKLSAFKDRVFAAATPVFGRASELPIVNPLLLRVYPQAINKNILNNAVEYTVSSEYLPATKTYPRGDARNYVGDMIDALLHPTTEHTLPEFATDLPRFNIVEIKKADGSISNTLVKDEVQDQQDIITDRSVAIENFLTYVVSQAQRSGNDWVTKDKLRPILSYLSQPVVGRTIAVLSNNFYTERDREQQKSEMLIYTPITRNIYLDSEKIVDDLELGPAVDLTLTIDGDKISLKYEIYMSCHATQQDAEAAMMDRKLIRDLKLNVETTIDFSLLSSLEGRFIPSMDAVTQHVKIESLSDEISFAMSLQIADLMKRNKASNVQDEESADDIMSMENYNFLPGVNDNAYPSIHIKVNNLPTSTLSAEILDRSDIKYAIAAVKQNAAKTDIDSKSNTQFLNDLDRLSRVIENGADVLFDKTNADPQQKIQIQVLEVWADSIQSKNTNGLSNTQIKNIIAIFNQLIPIGEQDFFEKLTDGFKDCTINDFPIDFFTILQNNMVSELELDGSVLTLTYVCPMHASSSHADRDPNNRDIDLIMVTKLKCDFSMLMFDEDFVTQEITIIKTNPDININIKNTALVENSNCSVMYGTTNLEKQGLVFEASQFGLGDWSKNKSLRSTLGRVYTGMSNILKSAKDLKTTIYSATGIHRSASQYSFSSGSATQTPSPRPPADETGDETLDSHAKMVRKNLLTLQFDALYEQDEESLGKEDVEPDSTPPIPKPPIHKDKS
jgi:hypothetical protein